MVARQKAAKDAADAAAAAAEKRAQVDIPPAPVTPIAAPKPVVAAPKPVVAAPKPAPTPAPPVSFIELLSKSKSADTSHYFIRLLSSTTRHPNSKHLNSVLPILKYPTLNCHPLVPLVFLNLRSRMSIHQVCQK